MGAVGPLRAAEFGYRVGYKGEHSDNITRVSTNEKSDSIHSLLAGFAYQESTPDVVARVLAEVTYDNYQKNTFEDETLFDLNSSAVWTISPQRFFWTVQDEYQQGLLTSTAPETPANRTNYNVFSTGPDVYVRLAPVHTLVFGARVGDVDTGEVNADSRRFSGLAGWLYQSSPITTLSMNYQVLDVKFDDSTLNDDFTSQDVFFRAQFHPSHSQYIVDLGTTQINFDRGDDLSGPLTRLTWIRESTPETSFGASFSKEFSDTGTDALVAATPPAAGQVPPAPSGISLRVVTADVYNTKGGSIFYNHHGSQLGAQFLAGQRKLDYATSPEDRKETYGRLQFDYFFPGATTTASLFTDYIKTEYLDVIRTDNERNTGIRLDQLLSNSVSLGLEGRHLDHTSTDSSSSYVDNRILITLLYSSGPLFTSLRGR